MVKKVHSISISTDYYFDRRERITYLSRTDVFNDVRFKFNQKDNLEISQTEKQNQIDESRFQL